jgi:glucose/mannose-6-phosphate isomerase
MWSMIASLPAQYRWAADLDAPDVPRASSVLVCGMGGSGISGDYAQMAADAVGSDVRVHKDYGLPAWAVRTRPLVIAVSYSGSTAETLNAVSEAERLGLRLAVVATGGTLGNRSVSGDFPGILVPGGLQPRAALGYLVGAVVRLISAAGVIDDVVPDLREAATEVEQIIDSDGAGSRRDAARLLAERLRGRQVAAWASSGPTAVAAQRWAKQMHENAKTPAYWSLLPELDHNELVPWAEAANAGVGIVLIRDAGERPEIARRFELTQELIDAESLIAGEVWTSGRSVIARAATASVMGDLASVYLAEAKGVDPVSIAVLDELKNRL